MHGRRHARSWLPSVRAFGCGCPDRSVDDLFINPHIKGHSYHCSREHTQHASASQKNPEDETMLHFAKSARCLWPFAGKIP